VRHDPRLPEPRRIPPQHRNPATAEGQTYPRREHRGGWVSPQPRHELGGKQGKQAPRQASLEKKISRFRCLRNGAAPERAEHGSRSLHARPRRRAFPQHFQPRSEQRMRAFHAQPASPGQSCSPPADQTSGPSVTRVLSRCPGPQEDSGFSGKLPTGPAHGQQARRPAEGPRAESAHAAGRGRGKIDFH